MRGMASDAVRYQNSILVRPTVPLYSVNIMIRLLYLHMRCNKAVKILIPKQRWDAGWQRFSGYRHTNSTKPRWYRNFTHQPNGHVLDMPEVELWAIPAAFPPFAMTPPS